VKIIARMSGSLSCVRCLRDSGTWCSLSQRHTQVEGQCVKCSMSSVDCRVVMLCHHSAPCTVRSRRSDRGGVTWRRVRQARVSFNSCIVGY